MRMRLFPVMILALAASPAGAAESWGLPNEELATFDGKVVDVQCVLTGDCPRDCGAGRRQLGVLTRDKKLVLAMKNAVPFAGAVGELLPFCGQTITVDGLFSTTDGHRVFALQRLKPQGKDWIAADHFLADWAKANGTTPDSDVSAEWFRHDPRVVRQLSVDGKLGLGSTEGSAAPSPRE